MATPTTAPSTTITHKDFNGRIVFRPFNDPDGWEIVPRFGVRTIGRRGRRERAAQHHVVDPSHHHHAGYRDLVRLQHRRDGQRSSRSHQPGIDLLLPLVRLRFAVLSQDQMFQAAAAHAALGGCGHRRLLRYGDLSPDGRAADRIQPADRSAPSLRPLLRRWLRPGAWELLFRVDRMEVGQSAFTAGLASNTGTTDRSSPEASETTMGVNWYLNKWARAQLNWEHANFASPVQIGNVPHAVYPRRCVVHAVPGHLLTIAAACGVRNCLPGRRNPFESVPSLARRGMVGPVTRAGAFDRSFRGFS